MLQINLTSSKNPNVKQAQKYFSKKELAYIAAASVNKPVINAPNETEEISRQQK